MASFVDATHVEGGDGRYRATLDPEWFAWGPFGGYLAALTLRALGADSRLPWPATFSGVFLAVGKEGSVEIEVKALKRGKRAEALRATVVQQGLALFEATAWMIDRGLDGLAHDHADMPAVKPVDEVPSYRDLDDDYDSWYGFWRHMEGRPLRWHHPDERPPPDPSWQCWMRLNGEPSVDDAVVRAATMVMWLDFPAWNGAVHAQPWPLTHIAPTLDLTAQFRTALYGHSKPPAWVLVEGVAPTAGDGLIGGSGNVWTPSGELLALGTSQLICRPNPYYEQDLAEIERARDERRRE